MAYIGNKVDTAFTSLIKQDLTGASGTSLTLSHAVANANDIALYINNVRQEPISAYSTNGTAVTLTGSVASSSDIYVIYLARAVQTTVPPDGSVGLTSKVSGILPVANGGTGATNYVETNSVIETWVYDTTGRTHSDDMVLKYGFNRVTSNNTANKNGGMTHSTSAGSEGAGIWTFPSTGIWRIELSLKYYHSGGAVINSGVKMRVTTNNSTYNIVESAYSNGYTSNANTNIFLPYTLNVTDVSNVKFKHVIATASDFIVRGGTDAFSTKIHFIKLCPSV